MASSEPDVAFRRLKEELEHGRGVLGPERQVITLNREEIRRIQGSRRVERLEEMLRDLLKHLPVTACYRNFLGDRAVLQTVLGMSTERILGGIPMHQSLEAIQLMVANEYADKERARLFSRIEDDGFRFARNIHRLGHDVGADRMPGTLMDRVARLVQEHYPDPQKLWLQLMNNLLASDSYVHLVRLLSLGEWCNQWLYVYGLADSQMILLTRAIRALERYVPDVAGDI